MKIYSFFPVRNIVWRLCQALFLYKKICHQIDINRRRIEATFLYVRLYRYLEGKISDLCITTGLVIKYQIGYLNKANMNLKYIANGNSLSGYVLPEYLLEQWRKK